MGDVPDLISSSSSCCSSCSSLEGSDDDSGSFDMKESSRSAEVNMTVLTQKDDHKVHTLKILLVSPLIFNQRYLNIRHDNWIREIKIAPKCSDKINEIDEKYYFEMASHFCSLCNFLLNLEAKTPKFREKFLQMAKNIRTVEDLDTALQLARQSSWFKNICEKCSFSNQQQAGTALLIFLMHYEDYLKDDYITNFESICKKNEELCKTFHEQGNLDFKECQFQSAYKNYSKGLSIHSFSYVLYGNRSQTSLRLGNYLLAECDALRALFLKCDSTKDYYRFADAVYKQGDIERAKFWANRGIKKCEKSGEIAKEELNSLIQKINETFSNYNSCGIKYKRGIPLPEQVSISDSKRSLVKLVQEIPELISESESDEDFFGDQIRIHAEPQLSSYKPKETSLPSKQREELTLYEQKPKPLREKTPHIVPEKSRPLELRAQTDKLHSDYLNAVKEGSEAFLNSRKGLACQQFEKALDILPSLKGLPSASIKEVDQVILKYAYGASCIETGIQEKLLKSISIFQEILKKQNSISFPLAYLGLGRSYQKQNRFKEAVEPLKSGLALIENDFKFVDYYWPGTQKIIDESRPENLKEAFQSSLYICRNPPKPDAVCRYSKCEANNFKIEIYYTDADFKGFTAIVCQEQCRLQYHPNCWKLLKEDIEQTNDKEFLGRICLTPDCKGAIIQMTFIDADGSIKKEFKSSTDEKSKTSKHKKSRFEKKMEQKERKKRKKTETDATKEYDSRSAASDEICGSIEDDELALEDDIKQEDKPKPVETNPQPPVQPAEFDFNKAVVLKRNDSEEEELNKVMVHKHDHRREKKKKKQIMSIEEFIGDSTEPSQLFNEYMQRIIRLQGYRDNVMAGNNPEATPPIEPFQLPQLDPTKPFYVPENLRDNYEELENMLRRYGSNGDEKTHVIRENIFSYMNDFLKANGPLSMEDQRLIQEIESFPTEVQEIISNSGGIKEFLLQSLLFCSVGNYVCIMKDALKARDLNQKDESIYPVENCNISFQSKSNFSKSSSKLDSLDTIEPFVLQNAAPPNFFFSAKQPVEIRKSSVNILCESNTELKHENTIDTDFVMQKDSESYFVDFQEVKNTDSSLFSSDFKVADSKMESYDFNTMNLPAASANSLQENLPMQDSLLQTPNLNKSEHPKKEKAKSKLLENDSLIRFLKMVPNFSAKSKQEILCLILKTIEREGSWNNNKYVGVQNVKKESQETKMKSIRCAIDALSIPVKHSETQTLEIIKKTTSTMTEDTSGNVVEMLQQENAMLKQNLQQLCDKRIQILKKSSAEAQALHRKLEDVSNTKEDLKKVIESMSQQKENDDLKWQQERNMNNEEIKNLKKEIQSLLSEKERVKSTSEQIEKEFLEEKKNCEKYQKKLQMLENSNDAILKRAITAQMTVTKMKEELGLGTLNHYLTAVERALEDLDKRIKDLPGNPLILTWINKFEAYKKCLIAFKTQFETDVKSRLDTLAKGHTLDKFSELKIPDLPAPPMPNPADGAAMYALSLPALNYSSLGLMTAVPTVRGPGDTFASVNKEMASRVLKTSSQPLISSSASTMESSDNVGKLGISSSISQMPKSNISPPTISPREKQTSFGNTLRELNIKTTMASCQENTGMESSSSNVQRTVGMKPLMSLSVKPLMSASTGAISKEATTVKFSEKLGDSYDKPTPIQVSIPEEVSSNIATAPSGSTKMNAMSSAEIKAATARAKNNSFEKLMLMLHSKFPGHSREQLMYLVKHLRAKRGNTLSNLTMQQITNEISKMLGSITKAPPTKSVYATGRTFSGQSASQSIGNSMGLDRIAEPGIAWQQIKQEVRRWGTDNYEEDPCAICTEEMTGDDICTLECMHRFHKDCIRKWFNEQSTCPNCRIHALLPDEFPSLK